MIRQVVLIGFVFVLALSPAGIRAQDLPEPGLPDSIAKYYRVLRKSPARGHLYERFLDAWLESKPLSELSGFFVRQASEPGATAADQVLAGFHFSRKGELEKALSYFAKAAELDPAQFEARLESARLHARALDFEEAVAALEAAIAVDSIPAEQALEAGKLKGRILARAGRSEDAVAVWKALLATHPDDLDLHEDVVESLASEGMLDEAIQEAGALAAKTKDPYDQLLRRFRIAELQVLADKNQEAVATYEAALPLTGAGSWLEREILARVGTILRRLDEIDALAAWVAKRVEENPQRLELLHSQAALAAERGENDQAIAFYETLLERSPGDRAAEAGYVDILAATGDLEKAIGQQQHIVDLHPEDETAHLRLAELHAEAKQFDLAGAAAREAFARSAKGEIDYLGTAKQLERFQQPALAERLLEEGRAAFPDSEEIQKAQGTLLLAQGRKEEAVTHFAGLAKTAGPDSLLRFAEVLVRAELAEEAHGILDSRSADFGEDFAFVETLIRIATKIGKRENLEALTLRQLELAASPEEIDRALDLANATFANSEERRPLLDRLEKKDLRLASEICLAAQMLGREGEPARAMEMLEEAIASRGGDERTLLLQQQLSIQRRDQNWEDAARIATTLYTDPGGKTSRNVKELVAMLEQSGREADALPYIEEWKSLSPGASLPWMREADLLYRIDRGDEAIANLRKGTARFPEATELRLKLAELHDDLGDPGEAARIHWNLYESTEETGSRLRRVGDLYKIASHTNAVPDLIAEFEKRHQSNRTSPAPLLALAEVHRLDGDPAARETALTEAQRLAPEDLGLLNQIADVQLDQDDWEAALTTLSLAARLDPTTRSKQRIARVEIEFGNAEKGYRQLTDLALETGGADQSLAKLVEEIGDLMLKNGDAETAAEYLAGYLETFSDNYRLRYLHAVALEEAGNDFEAVKAFAALLAWPKEMAEPLIGTLKEEERERLRQVDDYRSGLVGANSEMVTTLLRVASRQSDAFSLRGGRGYVNLKQQVPTLADRGVMPPLDLATLRDYSLLHLEKLHEDADEATASDHAQNAIAASGIVDGDLFLAMNFTADSGEIDIPVEFLREHAADVTVQTLWAFSTLNGSPESPFEAGDYRNAHRVLKSTRPALAAIVAFAGGALLGDAELADEQRESVEYLRTLTPEKTDEFWALAMATGVYGMSQTQDRSQVVEKLIGAIERTVLSPDNDPTAEDYFTGQFVRILMRKYGEGGHHDKAVGMLEGLIKRTKASDTLVSPSAFVHFLMDYGTMSPGNPYGLTESIPHWVTGCFAGDATRNPGSIPLVISRDAAVSMLEKATDPSLRFLLATRIDETAIEKALMEQTVRPGGPGVDELLLFAAWSGQIGDFQRMGDLLLKARGKTKRASTRQMIDGVLVHAATRESDENSKLRKEGTLAMQRFLAEKPTLDEGMQQQLFGKLQQLGMTNEARKLAGTTKSRSTASQLVAGSQKSVQQKITGLLAAGKREAAVQLAAREIRTVGREAAKQTYGNWRNNFWYLREAVSDGGLAPDALKEVDQLNGDDKTERLYETAIASELFNQPVFARSRYERILELDSDNIDALSRLVWLDAATGDREKTARHFEGVELEKLHGLVAKVGNQIHGIGYDNPESGAVFTALEATLGMLARFPPDTGIRQLQWVAPIMQQLAANRDDGGTEIPFVHDISPIFSDRNRGGNEDASEALEKRRDDILLAFCESAKSRPVLARSAFTVASAYDLQRGGDPSRWVAEARALAAAADDSARVSFEIWGSQQHRCFPLLTPEEFLIREAWRRHDVADADAIVAGATGTYRPFLESFRNLYFGPAAEFDRFAEELTKGDRPASRSVVPPAYHRLWAMADRTMPYASVKAVLGLLQNEGQYHADWFRTWFYAAAATQDYPGHVEVLRDLREVTLDPDLGKVRERVAAAYKSNGGKLGWNGAEATFAYQGLATLAADEAYLFPAITVLRESGYEFQQFFEQIWKYRTGDYFSNSTNLRAFLAAAPWFGPVDQIDFVESAAFRNSGSLFDEFARANLPKEELLVALADRPDSFFKGFATLLVTHKGAARQAPGLALIGKHLAGFEALDPDKRKKWLELFSRQGIALALPNPKQGDVSPEAKAARWLIEQGTKTVESEVAEFLAATQASNLGLAPSAFENRMESLVRRVVATDHRRAADIMARGWSLIAKEQRGAGWSGSSSYNGWPVASEITNDYLEENVLGLGDVAFYVEVLKRDKKGEFPHSGWNRDMKLSLRIRQEVDRLGGVGDLAKSVPAMLERLQALIGEDPENHADILSLPFHHFIEMLPRQRRLDAILAADAIAKSGRPESRLALDLAMAGRFFMAEGSSELVNEAERAAVPDPGAWKAHALAQLGDERKNGAFRASLGNLYCHYGKPAGDDEIGLLMGSIMAGAFEKGEYFTGYNLLHGLQEFMPRQGMPGWDETARRLLAGWWKANRYNSESTRKGRAYDPVTEAIFPAIELALRLGDKDAMVRFRKEFGTKLHGSTYSRLPLLLISHGYNADALDLIKNHAVNYDGAKYQLVTRYYVVRLVPENLPKVEAFLASIDDPQLAAFARAFLHAAPDLPVADLPQGWVARGGRLVNVAKSFSQVPWTDETLKRKTLQQVLLEPNAATLLAKTLPDEASRIDLAAFIAAGQSPEIEYAARIPAAHCWNTLVAGNAEPFLQTWDAVSAASGDSYDRNEAREELARYVWDAFRRRGVLMKPEEVANLIPAFEKVFTDYQHGSTHFDGHDSLACAWVLAASLAGRAETCREWFDKQSPEKKKQLRTSMNGHQGTIIPGLVQTLKVTEAKEYRSRAERQRILVEFFGHPLVQSAFPLGQPLRDTLFEEITKKLLTREEVLALADDFHAAWPREGHAAFELAAVARAGKKVDLCMKWGALAVEETAENTPVNFRVEAILTHAEDLVDAGKAGEAKSLLAKLPDGAPAQAGRLNRLRERLR